MIIVSQGKKRPKRHFGIENAVLGLFFVCDYFSSVLTKMIPKTAVEYDYCVSGKISPKRHFGIEHAVLGLYFLLPKPPGRSRRIRPNKHFEAKVAVWAYISFSPNLPEGAAE